VGGFQTGDSSADRFSYGDLVRFRVAHEPAFFPIRNRNDCSLAWHSTALPEFPHHDITILYLYHLIVKFLDQFGLGVVCENPISVSHLPSEPPVGLSPAQSAVVRINQSGH